MSDELIKEQKRIDKLNKMNAKEERKLERENKKSIQRQQDFNPETERGKRNIEMHRRNTPPVRSTLEEVGNAVSHGLGACFGVVALILMLLKSNNGYEYVSASIYGACIIIMMLMSCLYHAFKKGSMVKRIWRRFDYTSIYLLIGGTFAPLLLVDWRSIYNNYVGLVFFIIQWVMIVTGITLVCIFGPGRVRVMNFILYFLIGWSGIMFIPGWIKHNPELLWMILGGGIVYTIGMIPFAFDKVKCTHFIWHIFVLIGAIVQFLGIYLFVF